MIIRKPEIEQKVDKVLVKADVELERRKYLSRSIWFEVPVEYASESMTFYEPFVVAVLMMAMSLGENIKVSGNLSPRLMYGLKQYQELFNFWFPRKLKIVDIEADSYKDIGRMSNTMESASFFSGGVDSTYTLYCHLREKQIVEQYRIKSCIFVHGWDIPLAHRKTYESLRERYEQSLSRLGVRLIPVRTNMRELLVHAKVGWDMTHGTALGSVGLLMQSIFSRVYIPGSRRYDRNLKLGSNVIADPLLSTENVSLIYHGANMTRLDKTVKIAGWQPSYNWLRVCWLKSNRVNNCCRCEKCVRSMVPLEVAGVLQKYKTFPSSLNPGSWKGWKLVSDYQYDRMDDLIKYARSKGRLDVVEKVIEIKKNSRKQETISKFKNNVMKWMYYFFLRTRDIMRLLVKRQP